MKLAWDAVSGDAAAGYVVRYGTAPGKYSHVVNVGDTTTYAIKELSSATTYYFVVQAYNDDGIFSLYSAEVSGTTPSLDGKSTTTAPPAPHSLAVTLRDGHVIDLAWQVVGAGAPAYRIEVGTTPGSRNVGTFTTGPTTSFAIGDLPSSTYYIRVRGANDAGVSTASNEVMVAGRGGPDAPRELAVAILPGSVVRLTWQPPLNRLGVIGYSIEIGSAPGRKDFGSMAVDAREITIAGIANRIYFVRVRARTTSGVRAPSNEEVVQAGNTVTCEDPPRAPLFAANVAGTLVNLSWSRNGGEAPTGFLLDVGTAPGRADVLTAQFGANVTTIWTPAPNGSYSYRIRAVNKCGASRFAAQASVIAGATAALPGAPAALDCQVSDRSLSLTWDPPFSGAGPTHYVIEVTDANRLPVLTIDTGNVATAFAYDAVPPGVYLMRVRAANAAGFGWASNRVSVVIDP